MKVSVAADYLRRLADDLDQVTETADQVGVVLSVMIQVPSYLRTPAERIDLVDAVTAVVHGQAQAKTEQMLSGSWQHSVYVKRDDMAVTVFTAVPEMVQVLA